VGGSKGEEEDEKDEEVNKGEDGGRRVQVGWSGVWSSSVSHPRAPPARGRRSRTSPLEDCTGCSTNRADLGEQPEET